MFSLMHTDSQDSTPDLRNYMCFGCSPDQPKFTDEQNKVIRICKSAAEKVYSRGKDEGGAQLQVKQSGYDVFGLHGKDDKVLIQSLDLTTSEQFFKEVLPPYFEDYKIQISDDNTNCWTGAL